jgi:hypothetical protein
VHPLGGRADGADGAAHGDAGGCWQDGQSALHGAVGRGKVNMIKALCQHMYAPCCCSANDPPRSHGPTHATRVSSTQRRYGCRAATAAQRRDTDDTDGGGARSRERREGWSVRGLMRELEVVRFSVWLLLASQNAQPPLN